MPCLSHGGVNNNIVAPNNSSNKPPQAGAAASGNTPQALWGILGLGVGAQIGATGSGPEYNSPSPDTVNMLPFPLDLGGGSGGARSPWPPEDEVHYVIAGYVDPFCYFAHLRFNLINGQNAFASFVQLCTGSSRIPRWRSLTRILTLRVISPSTGIRPSCRWIWTIKARQGLPPQPPPLYKIALRIPWILNRWKMQMEQQQRLQRNTPSNRTPSPRLHSLGSDEEWILFLSKMARLYLKYRALPSGWWRVLLH